MATTALASVAFAGSALAQESMMMTAQGNDINIGGYYEFGYRDYSDNSPGGGDQSYADSELFIDFSRVDDNGLEYGVNIQLEVVAGGNSSAVDGDEGTDEASIYIAGDFGRVVLGNNDRAADQYQTWAPTHAGTYGQDDGQSYPTFYGRTAPDGDDADTDPDDRNGTRTQAFVGNPSYNDDAKIAYFSPTLGGFSLGLSWESAGEGDDITVGADYSMNTGWGDFTFRGSYADNGESNGDAEESDAFGITYVLNDITATLASSRLSAGMGDSASDVESLGYGIGYNINDQLSVGAYFGESEDDVQQHSLEVVSLSGGYTILPGLSATLALNTFELSDTGGASNGITSGDNAMNEGEELIFEVDFSF